MKNLVSKAFRNFAAAALLSVSGFASAGPINVDVLFLVDSSGSESVTTFKQELALVNTIRNQFLTLDAANDSVSYRFGVIQFGTSVKVVQQLGTAYNATLVNGLTHMATSSYLKNAVQAGINLFDTESATGNIRQMFLFTDGIPSPSSQTPAPLAATVKDKGIHVTAIGLPFDATASISPLVENAQRDMIAMASYTANDTLAIHQRLTAKPADVPEPGSIGLMLLGLGACGAVARRRSKPAAQQ